MKIPHPIQAREPPKVKKLKIGVARKLDLIGPNCIQFFISHQTLPDPHSEPNACFHDFQFVGPC